MKEENITIVSLIMARPGVYTIASAFPKVRIVTASVDPDTNEKFHIIPGIGKFNFVLYSFDEMVQHPCISDLMRMF